MCSASGVHSYFISTFFFDHFIFEQLVTQKYGRSGQSPLFSSVFVIFPPNIFNQIRKKARAHGVVGTRRETYAGNSEVCRNSRFPVVEVQEYAEFGFRVQHTCVGSPNSFCSPRNFSCNVSSFFLLYSQKIHGGVEVSFNKFSFLFQISSLPPPLPPCYHSGLVRGD